MKKRYICPESLAVKLHTSKSLLTVSGKDVGSLLLDDEDDVITDVANVWAKENSSIWDEEW